MNAYASVVLDMDSTISSVEGIDWLAERCGPAVAREVMGLTERAMSGALALGDVYGERLALIRPSAARIGELAAIYRGRVAPGASRAIVRLRAEGVALAIVSGGVREAILPCARELGFRDADVHAVRLLFDQSGSYADFDRTSPLTTQDGKCTVVRALALPRPILAVGDGATDAAMAPAVDTFAAFTGFVRRTAVVAAADVEVRSFDDLLELVLS